MNSRYQILATQASDWCVENADSFDTNAWQWERKFAELIVEDCVNTITEVKDKANKVEFLTAILFIKAIKDKFGIKE